MNWKQMDIDVPWIEDGLRDLGHKRQEMTDIFKSALEQRNIPYTIVSGDFQQREGIVRRAIERILKD